MTQSAWNCRQLSFCTSGRSLPTPFSNHQEGKSQQIYITMDCLCGQHCSEPPIPNTPRFWCVPHVFPHNPQCSHGRACPDPLWAQHTPRGRCRHKHNTNTAMETPTPLLHPPNLSDLFLTQCKHLTLVVLLDFCLIAVAHYSSCGVMLQYSTSAQERFFPSC